jgi:hypothetical protein
MSKKTSQALPLQNQAWVELAPTFAVVPGLSARLACG